MPKFMVEGTASRTCAGFVKSVTTMLVATTTPLRRQVHAKIDPLWQSGEMKRGHVYSRISKALGYTYHTGEADEETCLKVLSLNIKSL